jgi:hypothetical protein
VLVIQRRRARGTESQAAAPLHLRD